MCFSAQISFLAAAVLASIGVLTFLSIQKQSQIPFASLPFFFALQQAAEGILWIFVPRSDPLWLITLATYTFLSIAFIVYPVWLPLSAWTLEKNPLRRTLIALCGLVGIAWSSTATFHMIRYGAIAQVTGCHIYYALEKSILPLDFSILLYSAATILPFFIVRSWLMKLFGAALAISCVVSYYLWYAHFVSVWCFFVALLSLGVYTIIRSQNVQG